MCRPNATTATAACVPVWNSGAIQQSHARSLATVAYGADRVYGPPMQLTDAQIATRLTGLGASETYTALGMNRFESPLDVWARKVGLVVPTSEAPSGPAEWGHLLEPVVLQRYSDKVHASVAWQETLRHPRYPVILATPDGRHVDGAEIVEVKTTDRRNRRLWGDPETGDVPESVLVQVQQQMACAGPEFQRAHVPLLVLGGTEFLVFHVDRDDALIDELLAAAVAWWDQYVVPRVQPPNDPRTGDRTLRALWPRERAGDLRPWTTEAVTYAQRYADASAAMKRAEEAKVEAAAALKALVGDAEGFEDPATRRKCTWKAQATAPRYAELVKALGVSAAEIDKYKGTTRVLRVTGFEVVDE